MKKRTIVRAVKLINDELSEQNSIKNVSHMPKSKKIIKSEEINADSIKIYNNTNDQLWTHVFSHINYDGSGEKIITAEEIKNAKNTWKGKDNQFEPRLLCKQDTDDERPKIFKDNNLCIISIKNGSYLLTKNNIYCKLEYPEKKTNLIKKCTGSILLDIGDSECSLIDNLRYSGLFESDKYLNESIEYGSLLNGRHRCSFNTKIGDKEVDILGSQYETDSCYESKNKILLIEAKGQHNMSSFNIRQLYYPYRTIYDLVNARNVCKEIICLFINKNKDNSIHIWKFEFTNPLEMTSIKNIAYDKYKFY
jgi:hypothetical protein